MPEDRPDKPTLVTLNYGRTSCTSVGRDLGYAACVVLLLVAGIATVHIGCKWFYWYDLNGVRSTLQAVPGAQMTSITGRDDDLVYKVIDAELTLNGPTARSIYFNVPTAWDLRRGNLFRVQFAPYGVLFIGPDAATYGNTLDLGRDGDFRDFLPIELNSVEDLVNRYDDIVAVLGQMPATGFHVARDGKEYWYKIYSTGQGGEAWSDLVDQYRTAVARRRLGAAKSEINPTTRPIP